MYRSRAAARLLVDRYVVSNSLVALGGGDMVGACVLRGRGMCIKSAWVYKDGVFLSCSRVSSNSLVALGAGDMVGG